MPQPDITIILNNNTYRLNAGNIESLREIPKSDRETLIELLEAVRNQEYRAQLAVEAAMKKAQIPLASATMPATPQSSTAAQEPVTTRLSTGDADEIMARLIVEERQRQKPGLTTQSLYKFLAGFAIIAILLILIS